MAAAGRAVAAYKRRMDCVLGCEGNGLCRVYVMIRRGVYASYEGEGEDALYGGESTSV